MRRIYFFFFAALVTLVMLAFLFFDRFQRMKNFSAEAARKREIMLAWQRIGSSLKSGLIIPPVYDSASHPLIVFHRAEFEHAAAEIRRIDSLVVDSVLHLRVDTLKAQFGALSAWILGSELSNRELQEADSIKVAELMNLQGLINRGFNRSDTLLRELQGRINEIVLQTDVSAFALVTITLILISIPSYWVMRESKEKSRLNNSLAEQRALVEMVIDKCGAAAIVFDAQLHVRYSNVLAEADLNTTKANLIGRPLPRVFPPAIAQTEYDAVKKTLLGQEVKAAKIRTAQGKQAILSTVILPQRYVLLLIRDISELENLNTKLAKVAETYDYAEQTSMIGSFRFDLTTETFEYSDNMYRILGCNVKEFVPSAETFYTFVHPDDVNQLRKQTANFINHGILRDQEYRVIKKSGEMIYVRNTGVMTTINNEPVLIGTLQDITAAREIADKLRERTEFAEAILNASVDSIVVIDQQHRILSANKKANLFGDRNIIGEHVLDVFPLIRESGAYDDIIRALKGEFIHYQEYYSLTTKRYYESFFIPLHNNEDVTAVVIVAHDITDIMEAKKIVDQTNAQLAEKNTELKQMNEELTSFAYVASHDLQEPLRKIQTFISKISAENGAENLPPTTQDYLRRINQASLRMRNLINDLLTYSRVSRTDSQRVDTDLNILLANVVANLKDEREHAQIEWDTLPTIPVVPFQIEQLFTNLISNALKFRKKETPPIINVRVRKVDRTNAGSQHKTFYQFMVSDNGIGFDNQYNQQIFQLFQRLHGVSEYPGTGLGLAICKKIVENHEGQIAADGREHEGATFTITLPVLD